LGSAGALPVAAVWLIRHLCLHACYPAEFGRFTSNNTSVINDILLKNRPLASLFNVIKVVGTDTNRSASYDFLLRSTASMGLSRTVSEFSDTVRDRPTGLLAVRFVIRRFLSKIANFPTPHIRGPIQGVALGIW